MVAFIARRALLTVRPAATRTFASTSLGADKGPVQSAKETVDAAQKELGKKLASGIESAEQATKSAAETVGMKTEEVKKDASHAAADVKHEASKAADDAKFQAKKASQ